MNTTPTPDPTGYLAACQNATTAQGLDPVVAALTRAGYSVQVEQTGGFTMVAVTDAADPAHGIVAITDDGTPGEPRYMVGAYMGDTWNTGESDDVPTRYADDVVGMVADVASARDFLADLAAAALTPAQVVQASVAWQYRTTVEEPAGYVQLSVPGGVILVSVDHPNGVYGGFYLTTPDGHDDQPSPVMTGRGPLTFANAGVWDVSRIVSALRGEHGINPLSAVRILGDYMA